MVPETSAPETHNPRLAPATASNANNHLSCEPSTLIGTSCAAPAAAFALQSFRTCNGEELSVLHYVNFESPGASWLGDQAREIPFDHALSCRYARMSSARHICRQFALVENHSSHHSNRLSRSLWPQQAALKDICDSSVEEPVYHVKQLKNPGAETTLESTCVVSEFTSMQSSAFYPSTKEKEKAESSSIAEALNDQLPEMYSKETSPIARDATTVLRNIFCDDPQAASETDSCSIAEMLKYTVEKNPLMDNTEEMSIASVSHTYGSCGASALLWV